ncbi:MAG TPA: hypothetical protein DCZ91_23100 [Lachnospiraceae bacterium]|nr:hypothetical protein [Lachnospiraceae bacterium]
MRKKDGKRTAYALLAAVLACTVSGCGTPAFGQVPGENPVLTEGDGNTGGPELVSGNNEENGSGALAAAVSHGSGGSGNTGGASDAGGSGSTGGASDAGGTGSTGGSADAGGSGNTGGNAGVAGKSGNGQEYASAEGREAVTNFGLRLLQGCTEAKAAFPPQASMPQDISARIGTGENILVSPLSVISALAMTANGAGGRTLEQMEDVMGMPVQELSAWLSAYREALPESEQYRLNMANSIWFTEDERFTIEPKFLKTNEDFFGAGVYRSPFDDSTLKEINGWVEENTDGMIDRILDEIPPDAVMYLVNALAFDAEWQEIYHDYQVREGEFTQEDGMIREVEMMYSTENEYLEDTHGEGFLKYYADGKYAFAALLPEEGMALTEYLYSLNGAKLREILENPVHVQVDAAVPKYESEYSIEMSEVLQSLGMTDAFDIGAADFSGLGHSEAGNLYISRVMHKTYIAVDEKGTKAGAATAVEIKDECAAIEEPKVMTVHLDRPFLYMIIDCGSNVPVFMGTVETVGQF